MEGGREGKVTTRLQGGEGGEGRGNLRVDFVWFDHMFCVHKGTPPHWSQELRGGPLDMYDVARLLCKNSNGLASAALALKRTLTRTHSFKCLHSAVTAERKVVQATAYAVPCGRHAAAFDS
jgi:hypothetical protein